MNHQVAVLGIYVLKHESDSIEEIRRLQAEETQTVQLNPKT